MGRSFAYMVAREMSRAAAQQEREKQRQAREYQRQLIKAENERLKAQAKRDKEQYIQSKIKQSERMTEDIHKLYDAYSKLALEAIERIEPFSFKSLKKEFLYPPFDYKVPHPTLEEVNFVEPVLEAIPSESWLEDIFASKKEKRLRIIAENEKRKIAAEEDYKAKQKSAALVYEMELTEYNKEKEKAKQEWLDSYNKAKAKIENQHEEVNEFEQAYLSGDEKAFYDFYNLVFGTQDYAQDNVEAFDFGYNSHIKKLVVNLIVKSKDEIFEADSFKYYKSDDTIRPVKMKVADINDRMRKLLVQIAIATTSIAFKNDSQDFVDSIVVNIYHNDVCCISSQVDKKTFVKYDFSSKSAIPAFTELQMRVFKQLATGVKSFDTLYAEME